jgi:membrane-associated phospholipid phosphatase
MALSQPGIQRERPTWYVELVLLVGGYLLFGLAQAAVDRGDPAATNNAELVQRLEQALHIAVEYPVNNAMLDHPAAIYLTGYFYRLSVIAVPAVLIWLYVSRPASYRRLRTVVVVLTLLDLPLVWLFPAAPPRFALDGIVDYMATHDILGGAEARVPRPGVNLLAAMPSMHIAWTTWCAYAVWSAPRQRGPRGAWLAWLLPAFTAFVVLATGHHYVLDILAGVALVAFTIQLTSWVSSPRNTATSSGGEPIPVRATRNARRGGGRPAPRG